jgi:hypothetical protein
MIIDATIPKRKAFAQRTKVPQRVLDRIRLEDYIDEDTILALPKYTDSLRSS